MQWHSKSTKQRLENPGHQGKRGTIAKSGSKTKTEAEDSVDLEEVSGAAEAEEAAEEAAKIIQEEEEIVEEVEVIMEEVNCNRSLEQLMDIDSSTSVMEPG